MTQPVNLIATIPCNAGSGAAVLALLNEYGEHCLTMPGTERFEPYQLRDDADTVFVIERYADEAAFQLHLDDPENAVLNGKLADLTPGGSSLQFLTQG